MMKPSVRKVRIPQVPLPLCLIEDLFRFGVHFCSIVSLEEGKTKLERVPEGGRELTHDLGCGEGYMSE